jgi:hypothetical protein
MNTERVLRRLGATFCAPTLNLDSSLSPPLMGLARVAPASAQLPGASTPGRCCHLPSVCRLHPMHIMFRPRGFSPPRRFPPLWGSGHLAARCGQGSLRFTTTLSLACFVTRESRSSTNEQPLPFPAYAVHSLRSIPLADSRSASLRPLPSCRCRPPHTLPYRSTTARMVRDAESTLAPSPKRCC